MFNSWSDGGAVSHDITPPTSGLTYTASYAPGGPGTALLVVGGSPTTLGTGDSAVKARLQALGYSVVVVGDAASTTADASGKQLVAISSTVSSGNVGYEVPVGDDPGPHLGARALG